MSNFFFQLEQKYNKWNDFIYKYLVFLYNLSPVKKSVYSFFIGTLAGLSMPPFKLFFLLPIAFASVIRLTDFCQKASQAFWVGFWFCLGFFAVGLYWISFAVLNNKEFIWLFPFALFGIPALLSFYTATLFPIYLSIVEFFTATRKVLIFSSLWVLFEFGRYFIFQFPWNFIGYAFTFSLNILQITSIIGILGLSLIVIIWASSFHLMFLTGDVVDFIKYLKFFLFINIIIILLFLFGFAKTYSFQDKFTETKIRIVQGNSSVKNNFSQNINEDLKKYIYLTKSKGLSDINYIIWPEGATSALIFNSNSVQQDIANILQDEQILVSGSARIEESNNSYEIFNSMIFVNRKSIFQYYDKKYLVPFGEFIPFKSFIKLKAISNKIQDFSRGSGLKTMQISSNVEPFTPLICYEVAFSGRIINKNQLQPKWILNITNDAWYLKSSGPFQHLEIARVRAIEEGLPLIRAANSGISAVFNENGKMLFKTKLSKVEVLDFKLPKKQQTETFFSLVGNIPILSFLILFLIYSMGDFVYRKNDKTLNNMLSK